MNILVTGGAGYIGSHTVLELLNKGYDVKVVDNLCNSSAESLKRVEALSGKKIGLSVFDLRDTAALNKLFEENSFDGIIHFAGLKAVAESVAKPLEYYDNNISGSLALLQTMDKFNVRRLIFSSSATVYGDPEKVPITEDMAIKPANPYGQTKAMIERFLFDLAKSNDKWQIVLLRYFNPIGAHESGQIGEDPNGVPNNLVPYISQFAVGKQKELVVFGNDYDTIDGTGVRDYIHVTDLALGHIAAFDHIEALRGCVAYNLGTGHGSSVLEIIKAYEKACGKKLPYTITGRRMGDIAICYADSAKAQKELNWTTTLSLDKACADAWRWQSANPEGYQT